MLDENIIYFIAALVLVGLCAGFVAGLFGVGGGVIVVPALYALFVLSGVDQNTAIIIAVSSSLVTIVPTSIASVRAHLKLKNIDLPTLKIILMPMIIGSLLGSVVVIEQQGKVLLSVFSVMLVFVSAIILYQYGFKKNAKEECEFPVDSSFKHTFVVFLKQIFALFLGFISSLSGVGGGALGVPWLMRLGLRIHRAVGTASVFGLLISLPAIISILLFSTAIQNAPIGTWKVICIPAVLILSVCTVITAPIGAKVGKLFSERILKLLFCFFLGIIGLRLIASIFLL